jgi:quinol monooxygenase YgiN
MIVISGTVQVQPPLRAEAIAKAVWMQQLSQAEPGCRCYRFYTDLEDPNCFRIFEEWASEEALKAHFQTPHMAEFNAVLAKVLASKPNITRYLIAEYGSF